MPSAFSNSPFGKYLASVKASPKGLYNRNLLLTVIMFALCGMPKGWDEGTTASITQLKSFQREFNITPKGNPEQISNIVSFVNITAGAGALASFLLNDRLGRIWSYRLYMFIYAVGNIIETFSNGNLPALYVGRLVAGAGIGACTVVGPMAIVEIAPATTRGLMTLWFNVCMLSSQMIGIFTVYGCDRHVPASRNLQYQTPFFVQCFVPALGIVMSFFLYESPRWLCLRGKQEEALATLITIRGLDSDHPYILEEWDQMKDQLTRENEEFGGLGYGSILRETFCVRSNLRRVQLVVVAYILAQLSGANAITNYLPEIFGIVGVESTDVKVYASGLYAMVKLVCCIAASLFFVDVVGRRKSLFIGITVQILCHSYLAGYLNFFIRDEDSVPKGASDFAIAAIYIHAFGWAVGLYTLPYLFGAELWPNRLRSFGGSLSQCFHWLFYFGITKATPSLLNSLNQWGAFVFFAVWCLVAIVYVFVMVPETAGRALENIDELFQHPWYLMRKYARAKEPITTASTLGHSTAYDDVDWHLPRHSWETHVHVFDPEVYPYSPDRSYTPVPASYQELLTFNSNLTVTHTPQNIVLVQPSTYGTDNSLVLDLLRNHSQPESLLRAIAVIDPEQVHDDELNEMDVLGVRGVRINTQASTSDDAYEDLRKAITSTVDRVARFKHWKCQLYISGESWDHISDIIKDLPIQVIADHQGGMKGLSQLPEGTKDVTAQPGFASLMALAKSGKVFVKVSALYRSSNHTTGGYDDLEPLVRYFAEEIPQQLIWGSDWPHTGSNRTEATRYVPEPFRIIDNEAVLRNIRKWVGPRLWHEMTVVTPAKLYF
ncbi:hypothetical protein diail_5798 [Neofusicoccum parvum]|uniref:Uncharacterized protein n=1 Tax=Neofusicoccum parvum TaxID=310453 RepID=A0ACB5SHP7_9PEZI|nr:hypothetical protein diail_5798 [Neofusicoccum parvum]